MIAKQPRYICLVSYNCNCHPIGKPVSESTIKRHRENANRGRLKQGLKPLPRGPRYTSTAATKEYNLRYHRNAKQGEIQTSNPPVQYLGERGLHANPGLHSATLEILEVNDTELSRQRCDDPGTAMNANTVIQPNETPTGREQVVGDVQTEPQSPDIEHVNEHGLMSVLSHVSSPNECTADSEANDDYESEIEAPTAGEIHRSAAEFRFKEWAQESKGWIKLYVDFSLQGNVMSEILSLIQAPFCFATLKRNLLKYSGFYTQSYRTCNNRELIQEICANDSDEADVENPTCSQFELHGHTPDWNRFEYLPILPRLKAWMSEEKSCKTLFDYLHSQISKLEGESSTRKHYEDFFDGELFSRVASHHGGTDALKNDVFLAISCDGFQTYENDSYGSWPIMGMILNMPPCQRFLMKNILPLGFIKGPIKPTLLDTFFKPFLSEIAAINEGAGTTIQRWDGGTVAVKVHIVFITADGPASQLLSGAVGGNGKSCCRLCFFYGYYCPLSRRHYYPSMISILNERGNPSNRVEILYDIDHPCIRTASQILSTLEEIERTPNMPHSEREKLRRDTGIKRSTVLLEMPSIFPYKSFLLDTMHLFMNITKDILQLLKGENTKLQSRGFTDEPFIISSQSWKTIDLEMKRIPAGTLLSAFGVPTRPTSNYANWKAIECRDFLLYSALVLFDGHLSLNYLKGLRLLCGVVRLCSKPYINFADLDELDYAAKGFVKHFEKMYYKYDPRRVFLCKSTLHALIHLKRSVQLCGPLVTCNQFWVERFTRYKKAKLKAKRLPSEALTEMCKLSEAYKLYFKDHFALKEEDAVTDPANSSQDVEDSAVSLLTPCDVESLSDPFHCSMNTRNLLDAYLKGVEGMNEEEAELAVRSDKVVSFGRLRIRYGGGLQVLGACRSRRHRSQLRRADCYVSAEFQTSDVMERNVHYGRILKILQYDFGTGENQFRRTVVMMDWVSRLQIHQIGEFYKASPLSGCFSKPSIESYSVLLNSVGVIEHKSPCIRNRRTYFIDPQRETYELLSQGKLSPDGIDGNLAGVVLR